MTLENYSHYYMSDDDQWKERINEIIKKREKGEVLDDFELKILNKYFFYLLTASDEDFDSNIKKYFEN